MITKKQEAEVQRGMYGVTGNDRIRNKHTRGNSRAVLLEENHGMMLEMDWSRKKKTQKAPFMIYKFISSRKDIVDCGVTKSMVVVRG